MLALLGPFLPKIAMALAALAAMAAAYFGIRRSGVQAQKNADMRQELRDVKTSSGVESQVAGESDAAVADDLRKQRNQ
jgi:hypothetical protein